MTEIRKSARVPFSAEQMFALVADVESYPRFLPWCSEAHVVSRQENEITASLALSKGGLRQSFTTRNRHQPSERIDVELVDGPFKHLQGHWRFEPMATPAGVAGSVVALSLDFEFGSKLLGLTFGKAFHTIASTLVDAFCARAEELYAPTR